VNFPGKSFVLLAILLVLLFIPSIIELFGGPSPSSTLMQSFGFALALIGLFVGAYFEINRLAQQLKEDRLKERRQYQAGILAILEHWIDEVSQTIEDIYILHESSPRDDTDNSLLLKNDQVQAITEKLLRPDHQWFIIIPQAANIVGLKKGESKWDQLSDEQKSLMQSLTGIGAELSKTLRILGEDRKTPCVDNYRHLFADAKVALNRLRLTLE
jgi:hypothetical protein